MKPVMTPEQYDEILVRSKSGETGKSISEDMGFAQSIVSRVVTGQNARPTPCQVCGKSMRGRLVEIPICVTTEECRRARRQHETYKSKGHGWRQGIRAHGITEFQYIGMLFKQDGKCLACGLTPAEAGGKGTRLVIDHDHSCCPGTHSCGKCIRGLLCANCNLVVGLVHEDFERAQKITNYLKETSNVLSRG